MKASMSGSGWIFCCFSLWASSVSISATAIISKGQSHQKYSENFLFWAQQHRDHDIAMCDPLCYYSSAGWHRRWNLCRQFKFDWSSDACIPYLYPTPWQRAAKSRVSRTVSSPMWLSIWLIYADVLCGTNSFMVCPLYVITPDLCHKQIMQLIDVLFVWSSSSNF